MIVPLDPDAVVREACGYYQINVWDFRHTPGCRCGHGPVMAARQAVCVILERHNEWGRRETSDLIGWRAHSTALRCIAAAKERAASCPAFAGAVDIIVKRAGQGVTA